MGFRGTYFPDMAASGGVDLSSYPDPSCLPPPSKRRVILVKGYHGWAGRGLDIMLALHMIAPKLKGFQIRMFHCGPSGARMVEALRREDGLDVSIDPYYVDQSRAVERLAQARLVIGYGISDGISTTLLEAMAVGTFCVQASTACGCEWVRPGIDGIEVPPHDVEQLAEAILRAVTDDDLVDGAVIRNRREIESRWSFSAVAPKMHRGYRELIEGPRAVDKASPQPHVEA
jgi:glycosyltransferase involved in cell wall biosynthesis